MTNIILSGCNGKMGRVITELCAQKSDRVKIIAGFDINDARTADYPVYADPRQFDGNADVLLDFSNPAFFNKIMDFCVEKKLPAVICTTGLSESQLERLADTAKKIPVLRSGNMSLGINLIMDLLKKSARVLGDGFDVEIIEKHHNQKVDAPSGTAYMLADAVSQSLPYQTEYVYDRHSVREKRGKNQIGIHSVRGGTIVGEHQVIFAGTDEVIEIKHSVSSRSVFAIGAIDAAIFLAGVKDPGLYTMSDCIDAK